MVADPVRVVQPVLHRRPVAAVPQRAYLWKSKLFTGAHSRAETILAHVRGKAAMQFVLVDIEGARSLDSRVTSGGGEGLGHLVRVSPS
jgi:hypothetical protein